jgi:kynureninase
MLIRRLAGWWGNDAATRFQMEPTFRPTPGAKGYQHSCTPVLSSVPLLATLELIDKVSFSAMREKAIRLTSTLEQLLQSSEYFIPLVNNARTTKKVGFTILTPEQPWRGTQLSVFITGGEEVMPRVFARCLKEGLVGDERRPNVIRLSPVVLYNTFEEVGRAVEILEQAVRMEREDGAGQFQGEGRDVIGGDGP